MFGAIILKGLLPTNVLGHRNWEIFTCCTALQLYFIHAESLTLENNLKSDNDVNKCLSLQ